MYQANRLAQSSVSCLVVRSDCSNSRITGDPEATALRKGCRPTTQNPISGTSPTRLKASLATPGWDKGSGSRHVRGDYKTLRRFPGTQPAGNVLDEAGRGDSPTEC